MNSQWWRQYFSTKRYILWGALALVAVCFLAWFFLKDDPKPVYRTVLPARGDMVERVTAQGKVEAFESVIVGAQVSGQLKKVYAEIGDSVEKGVLIAEIDPEIYETQVAADKAGLKILEASLAEQKALVKHAETIMNRNKKLVESRAISTEEYEDSITNHAVAAARLSSLMAQIEERQSNLKGNETKLNYTRIYAPISGTIVSQTAFEGETLNANQTTPTILEIANLDTMTIRAQVAEADITKIKQGMPVSFTTMGAGSRQWHGTVRRILPVPETINDVVLYNVLTDVENKDRALMTAMSTQMFFLINEAQDTLKIPLSALGKPLPDLLTQEGETAYEVRLLEKGQATPKPVYIGLMDRTHAEVKRGLDAKSLVVVGQASGDESSANRNRQRMPRL